MPFHSLHARRAKAGYVIWSESLFIKGRDFRFAAWNVINRSYACWWIVDVCVGCFQSRSQNYFWIRVVNLSSSFGAACISGMISIFIPLHSTADGSGGGLHGIGSPELLIRLTSACIRICPARKIAVWRVLPSNSFMARVLLQCDAEVSHCRSGAHLKSIKQTWQAMRFHSLEHTHRRLLWIWLCWQCITWAQFVGKWTIAALIRKYVYSRHWLGPCSDYSNPSFFSSPVEWIMRIMAILKSPGSCDDLDRSSFSKNGFSDDPLTDLSSDLISDIGTDKKSDVSSKSIILIF